MVALPAHRMNMAPNTAQPWRLSLTNRPNIAVSANGISRIMKIERKSVRPLGF